MSIKDVVREALHQMFEAWRELVVEEMFGLMVQIALQLLGL